jgi:hypothetical protein
MNKAMVIAIALLFSLPMLAGDDIKTFPLAMYATMKSGKKLDKVYIDTTYDRTKGFKLGEVEYLAENRSGQVIEYLPKALGLISKGNGEYTLKIAVVKVSTYGMGGYSSGKVTVEGQILTKDGKAVVLFLTKAPSHVGMNGDDYSVAADAIASAIVKDLL